MTGSVVPLSLLAGREFPPRGEGPPPRGAAGGHIVKRVRLLCRRRMLWQRNLWARTGQAPAQGMAIPHEEADIVCGDLDNRDEEQRFYRTDPAAVQVGEALIALEDQRRRRGPDALDNLSELFGLSIPEEQFLALCCAPAIDPAIRRLYGYLHDDASWCGPSQWLAGMLFGWGMDVRVTAALPLVRWFLAAPRPNQDDPWGPTALWNADPRVVGFLSGSTDLAPALVSPGHWVADVAPCFEPSGATALRDALDRADRRGNRTEAVPRALVQLAGARGTGRKTWAAAICAKRDLRLLCIDAVKAFGERRPDESGPEAARPRSDLVVVAEREALLQRCALYWDRVDEASGPFRTALPMRAPLQFFGVRKPVAFAPEMPFVDVIPFSLPTPAEACRLWKHCLPRAGARSDPRDLAERFTLTPAEIVKLAEVAEGDPHRLEKASRALSRGRLAGLANLLPCPYEWDDLVVPEQTAGRLREILSQVRYRSTVYDDWGFGAKRPLGRGITALFAGRSGTGKTMAAQVLAREIGVVLYCIDIASVVSKYIGETEKNLKRIFDEAERLNAVLFFDEADALFGKRTEVRDAHDRYANIEVNYLLQRLESYEGLGVLATNRKGDLDSAFIRRVRFTIDFPLPKARERERIWRKALLETTPDGRPLLDGIQWRLLAQRLEISGAVIKDIALRAAFAACSEGTRIGMSHILDAARGELGKMGRMVDLILPQEQR